jgi:hypothetical protein
MLPSFIRLYKDFGVNWDLAYHIIRPQLYRSIYVSKVLSPPCQAFDIAINRTLPPI